MVRTRNICLLQCIPLIEDRGAYALHSSVYVCVLMHVCVPADGEVPPENPAASFGFGFGFPVGAGAGAGAGAMFEAPDPFASAGSMFDPMDPFATGAGTFCVAQHSCVKWYAECTCACPASFPVLCVRMQVQELPSPHPHQPQCTTLCTDMGVAV